MYINLKFTNFICRRPDKTCRQLSIADIFARELLVVLGKFKSALKNACHFHLLICIWYIIYDTEIDGNKEDLISLLMLEYYLKFRIIYQSLVGKLVP